MTTTGAQSRSTTSRPTAPSTSAPTGLTADVWETFERIVTPEFATATFSEFRIGDSPDSDTLAYVYQDRMTPSAGCCGEPGHQRRPGRSRGDARARVCATADPRPMRRSRSTASARPSRPARAAPTTTPPCGPSSRSSGLTTGRARTGQRGFRRRRRVLRGARGRLRQRLRGDQRGRGSGGELHGLRPRRRARRRQHARREAGRFFEDRPGFADIRDRIRAEFPGARPLLIRRIATSGSRNSGQRAISGNSTMCTALGRRQRVSMSSPEPRSAHSTSCTPCATRYGRAPLSPDTNAPSGAQCARPMSTGCPGLPSNIACAREAEKRSCAVIRAGFPHVSASRRIDDAADHRCGERRHVDGDDDHRLDVQIVRQRSQPRDDRRRHAV